MRQHNEAKSFAPPLPGIGDRILAPHAQREFWYQTFHNLELSTQLVDGRPDAVRAYLRHFWTHWSGPGYDPAEADLDHLVSVYAPRGSFAASIAWYRAGAGSVAVSVAERTPDPARRTTVPTTVLWPSHDPLFPREWSDRLDDYFADVRLVPLDGLDPRLIGMVLTRQGELIDTGAGAAALGDPVRVVAWLANTLGEMGAKLEAGHLVMTGALHAAVPMRAGDVFRADFDRLGPVTVRVGE